MVICCATTDNTSTSIRLNSSKQAQAPELQSVSQIRNHKCTVLHFVTAESLCHTNKLLPGQSFEKFAHCNKVQLIRTVENYRLDRQSLSKVFSCFCLSCACWTCGCPSKLQVQSSCQGQVASKKARLVFKLVNDIQLKAG